jgi:hypothetical protein
MVSLFLSAANQVIMESYKDEVHPWEYHIPPEAGTLFIGTFPTAEQNWSFPFFTPTKSIISGSGSELILNSTRLILLSQLVENLNR